MAVWGCVGRLRAGSMKDVLSAPHEINVRFSDYVPYGVEKKSPALGGGGAVDGSHVSMSVILPAGRQRRPKGLQLSGGQRGNTPALAHRLMTSTARCTASSVGVNGRGS